MVPRLHLDITVSGGRANPIETRRRLVDAEARRLEALGATLVRALFEDGLDHYGIAMRDPEGNEFDINAPASTAALTITQTPSPGGTAGQQTAVTVSVIFGGLTPGQPATLVLTTPGTAGALARAAATAAPDGTATTTLTTPLPAARTIVVTVTAQHQTCPRPPSAPRTLNPPSPAIPADPRQPR